MRQRSWAVAALLIGVLGGSAGCSAVPDTDTMPRSSTIPTPSATPTPVAERDPALMPGSCFQLIGENLHLLMEARELTLRSTDDTIQGRFSGIGYRGNGVPRALSCAYASEYGDDQPDGAQDNGRYEFGVEMLTAPEREVLLSALRAGPGENTTGLTEQTVGDALLFTQEGAPSSDTVPDDWAIVFTVFPDAWTMVWSPDGGPEVLDQHLEWAEQLEESLYPAS